MGKLMTAGGLGMWFVLAFGLVSLLSAFRFAFRPAAYKLRFVGAMSLATLFATLSFLAGNLGAVGSRVPDIEEWAHSPDMPLIVLKGFGESMAVPLLGFTLLSLTAFVTAIGFGRMPRPPP